MQQLIRNNIIFHAAGKQLSANSLTFVYHYHLHTKNLIRFESYQRYIYNVYDTRVLFNLGLLLVLFVHVIFYFYHLLRCRPSLSGRHSFLFEASGEVFCATSYLGFTVPVLFLSRFSYYFASLSSSLVFETQTKCCQHFFSSDVQICMRICEFPRFLGFMLNNDILLFSGLYLHLFY